LKPKKMPREVSGSSMPKGGWGGGEVNGDGGKEPRGEREK